jgi:hypothetical protein
MILDYRHFWMPNYKQPRQRKGGYKTRKRSIDALADLVVERILKDELIGQPRKPARKQAERVAGNAGFAT